MCRLPATSPLAGTGHPCLPPLCYLLAPPRRRPPPLDSACPSADAGRLRLSPSGSAPAGHRVPPLPPPPCAGLPDIAIPGRSRSAVRAAARNTASPRTSSSARAAFSTHDGGSGGGGSVEDELVALMQEFSIYRRRPPLVVWLGRLAVPSVGDPCHM